MPSKKAEIQTALVDRLKTIKTNVGYAHSIVAVYEDEAPLGLSLAEFEVPAIIVMSGDDDPKMEQQCLKGSWHFELQIWNKKVTDEIMLEIVRDVYKAIFANSATAKNNKGVRSLHSAVNGITPLPIMSDLNMIEANRCYVVNIAVQYTTELWDL